MGLAAVELSVSIEWLLRSDPACCSRLAAALREDARGATSTPGAVIASERVDTGGQFTVACRAGRARGRVSAPGPAPGGDGPTVTLTVWEALPAGASQ